MSGSVCYSVCVGVRAEDGVWCGQVLGVFVLVDPCIGVYVGAFSWCVDLVVFGVMCVCEKCLASGCWCRAVPAGC